MRIIAGEKRGHTLLTPMGMDTRPTLDRVKESVFAILQFELADRWVLDLFAGSGNLGLEALSRYAKGAVFNDSERACADIIRANVKKLGFSDCAAVYNLDYRAAILQAKRAAYRFDIVFLDPPYRAGIYEEAMAALRDGDVLSRGVLIVAEHAHGVPPKDVRGFALRDRRKYGEVGISIYRRAFESDA